jgi:GAF domain-containing protein
MNNDTFLKSLRGLTSSIARTYDLNQMCFDLCETVTEVLGADGAGVTVADASGALRYVTATNEEAATLERTQELAQSGPCMTAHEDGRVVAVDDVNLHSGWPAYLQVAESVGVGSVLGVPLATEARKLGALDVYSYEKRVWTEENKTVAEVFSDMTTAYILRSTELAEARDLGEQLQTALDSRVVIEQAKGMLASRHGVHVDAAFDVMRSHARSKQLKLADVAHAVINDGYDIAEGFQRV